jgi:4-azaleucine resistance transporter AzlC
LIVGAKGVAPILIGVIPFGLVAGAAVRQIGFGLAEAMGMSIIVFAGASQIAATTIFGSGAPLWVALLTALVINARMFIYSVSIAPHFSEATAKQRPFLGYLLVDQNYTSTMMDGRHREDVDVIWYYVGGGGALWIVWQISSIAGALLGPFIPPSWGLEFVVPLVFLAMLAPAIKDRTAVGVALVTGGAAAVLVPLLPMQSGLIVAILLGMVYGAVIDRPQAGEDR